MHTPLCVLACPALTLTHAPTHAHATQKKGGAKGEEGEDDEAKELARIMMPRKHQRMYQTAKRGQDKRAGEVKALQAKRLKLEQAQQAQQQQEAPAAAEAKGGARGKGGNKGRQQKA